MATVGLFIPCYIDQLYPQVGLATLELLERYGYQVEFPEAQTCCGQPMANTGCRPKRGRWPSSFSRFSRATITSSPRRAVAWRWCVAITTIFWPATPASTN